MGQNWKREKGARGASRNRKVERASGKLESGNWRQLLPQSDGKRNAGSSVQYSNSTAAQHSIALHSTAIAHPHSY